MLQLFASSHIPERAEGDLYKVIQLHGHSFPIHYGYYDDRDRNNPLVEPMPIYPDFSKEPKFTPDGRRFITKMQDACPHYKGPHKAEKDCAECSYYHHGDDLLGICLCDATKL